MKRGHDHEEHDFPQPVEQLRSHIDQHHHRGGREDGPQRDALDSGRRPQAGPGRVAGAAVTRSVQSELTITGSYPRRGECWPYVPRTPATTGASASNPGTVDVVEVFTLAQRDDDGSLTARRVAAELGSPAPRPGSVSRWATPCPRLAMVCRPRQRLPWSAVGISHDGRARRGPAQRGRRPGWPPPAPAHSPPARAWTRRLGHHIHRPTSRVSAVTSTDLTMMVSSRTPSATVKPISVRITSGRVPSVGERAS